MAGRAIPGRTARPWPSSPATWPSPWPTGSSARCRVRPGPDRCRRPPTTSPSSPTRSRGAGPGTASSGASRGTSAPPVPWSGRPRRRHPPPRRCAGWPPPPRAGWGDDDVDRWQYLALLGLCVLVTLPLEIAGGACVYRRPGPLIATVTPVVVLFGGWDLLAARQGDWWYSAHYTL